MPEGHTIHRVAALFRDHFVGQRVSASSPQGRFVDGARLLDGAVMESADAVGKQLFAGFSSGWVLRVHLGIYGAWSVSGDITPGAMGAPRVSRSGEEGFGALQGADFPPEPIGQVRLRLLTHRVVADLRGPAACMLHTPEQAERFISQLGPDPLVGPSGPARKRFIDAMTRTTTPVGVALMNQKIVGGIGNVYRAELLFRHRLNPFTPSSQLPAELLTELWRDWALLLRRGVKTGVMVTRDDLSAGQRQSALGDSALRHFVYHRAGLACYRCGEKVAVSIVATRKLYFCPGCQDQPSR